MSDIMFLHSPHLRSPAVGELQTLLQKHGWYHGAVDHEFGILTYQAVYRAKYWLGYPKPDHVAGPVLVSYLQGKKTPARYRVILALRQRKAKSRPKVPSILVEARAHLGTKESPPNSNHVLFSTWYGLIGSWCAMFVSYCAVKAGLTKTFQKGSHYAYVPFVVADARAGRNGLTIVHSSQVQPGDLVCYDWPGESPGIADHIGIFESWLVQGSTFNAIEGNTSEGNNSDGGEVMRRERSVSLVQAFVRVHG